MDLTDYETRENMHIIYLGSVVSNSEVGKLSGSSVAGNKMQCNIIKQLKKYQDVSMDIFSILSIASFPKDKKIFIKEKKVEIENDIWITLIPFINIPIIKQWSQKKMLYLYGKKIAKKRKDSIVFSYNLYMQEGGALVKLKKRFNLKVVSLLADLPIDDNYRRGIVGKKLYNVFFNIAKKNIKNCNNLIVLNKCAIDEFAPNATYIVVEGGVESKNYIEPVFCPKTKNIVYTGSLTDYSGIIELVEAMKNVKEGIILEIYGDGPLKKYIQSEALNTRNVQYKGVLCSQEISRIQKEAWLLINPRPVDDPIARVTFPSKVFEYMSSGRPVLSTKQTGYTKEYLDRIFTVDDNQPRNLANKINQIASYTEEQLVEIGEEARTFIYENKTWEKQVERIYSFLQRIK